jgi:cellulose/xylan binding protein with CBM9 domain
MKFKFACYILIASFLLCVSSMAQDTDYVANFDETSEGPWSDIEKTTLTIPKVANGSITLDGDVDSGEFGGFEAIDVIPDKSAWILAYAAEKNWESEEDSSFSFHMAYDDDFLYVGVNVKDDVVRSNDPNAAFWKDDAIEIIMDPLNTRFDENTDSSDNFFGGHCYVNYEGRFSAWDDDANMRGEPLTRWSSLVEWEYGEDKQIYGVGKETETGWSMEVKFHKETLIDPLSDFKWQEGQDMAFNIGIDDDDGADLAIQYFWANRIRAIGFTEEESWNWTEEEIANGDHLDPDITFYEIGIDANGRLSRSGTGEIILGAEATKVPAWSLY